MAAPEEPEMLRFHLTHEGTAGGEVTSPGVVFSDGSVALHQRYGSKSGDEGSAILFLSIFDMVSKIGTWSNQCTLAFLDLPIEG